MKPKFRVILERALEEGIRRGHRRAYKHVETPTEESIYEHIEEQVICLLCMNTLTLMRRMYDTNIS